MNGGLSGSPLDTAVISVADLDASLAFYGGVIGMTASAPPGSDICTLLLE